MYIRPNNDAIVTESKQKNDLFRKFKEYFIGATEKEFRQFNYYGKEGYISVNPSLEQRIIDTLEHSINEILPITGATGIGKTYLLLYCLKKHYQVDEIPTNHPLLIEKDGFFDLVYYSDFSVTEQSVLNNPMDLGIAKIRAMQECILKKFCETQPNVDDYIDKNKLEVKFYSKKNIGYQKELYALTTLLSLETVPIKNLVFIFDDLESLTEQQQFFLMENFLTLFENFKSKSEGLYNAKFIFSLRNSTYYNIYRQDFYNTHRASKVSQLSVAPSLSQIFKKRFEIILKSEKVKQAKNEDAWQDAKKILLDISERVDNSYTNLLLKLNNNNISNALDDFLNIISNRRWTQKNVNPTASFKIENGDYYINDTNILRILSMGEKDVYYQNTTMPIRCILPNPGVSNHDDLITLLVLRAFRHSNYSVMEDISDRSKLFSVEDITNQITNCIVAPSDKEYEYKEKQIHNIVQIAFNYYEDNRLIRKNVDPREVYNTIKYYMLPRGEQLFDLFFSQTILFNIFRDAFIWDKRKFDIRCSNNLNFEELILEAIKYNETLIELEERLFYKITENGMWRNYISVFGSWSISQSFYNAITKSVQQFYKISDGTLDKITEQLQLLKESVDKLVSVFDSEYEERGLF